MGQSSNIGPPLQDPLTMASRQLGEAKTAAETRGLRMLDMFAEIEKQIDTLKEHGLSISTVQFENSAIQAAWSEYTKGDWHSTDMPVMATEDAIVRRIRNRG